MSILACDIECNGFRDEATKVHCIASYDIQTGEALLYGPDEIKAGLSAIGMANTIIFHNAFGYDLPVLKRLYGFEHPGAEDSLVISRMANPDREGGHSLAAWGEHFGIPKPEHEDWSTYSDAMGVRCQVDAELTAQVVKKLISQKIPTAVLQQAYRMARLQTEIEQRGVQIDVDNGEILLQELLGIVAEKQSQLVEHLPPVLQKDVTGVKIPFLKNGDLSAMAKKHLNGDDPRPSGPFSRCVWKPRSMTSPAQMKEWLFSIGWIPDEFNTKEGVNTSPKITESSLEALENPLGVVYREMTVALQRSKILLNINKQGRANGWLWNARAEDRLEAAAILDATATGRFSHRNIVNVPGVEAPYGKQLRSLLVAKPGYILAGFDASGFQSRILAAAAWEYDGGDYANDVIGDGDVHIKNAHAFAAITGRVLNTPESIKKARKAAKAVGYAIMFGGGAGKVATMLKTSTGNGTKAVAAFWDNQPGPKRVKGIYEHQGRTKGYIQLASGRKLVCRSPHKALNLFVQGAEAELFKEALLLTADEGFDIVAHFHDEILCEIPNTPESREAMTDWVAALGPLITQHAKSNVAYEFELQFGKTYADVH